MSTNTKLAEALRLAREWFRHEEAGEGPQADDVIKAADEAIAAHDAEQAAEAVPAGFVLVPVEPTPEMLKASDLEHASRGLVSIALISYRAMLAAAPATPAQTVPSDKQLLARALDLLEEAASYTGCETWSPSLTEEITVFVARTTPMLATTPSPAPAMGRDAFEAWAANYSTIPLERDDDDRLGITGYTVLDQTMLWDAWQAAMTRARAAVESVPVPRTWDFATSRHSWVTSQDFDDYRAAVLRALGEP